MKNKYYGDPFIWITDADNTLWDTDLIYREAQLFLLSEIERETRSAFEGADKLQYVRRVDEALATRDHRGLKYPVEMLVAGLASRLSGAPMADAVKDAINGRTPLGPTASNRLASNFSEMLSKLPPLRLNVREGLALLHAHGADVFVVTEGSKERIERTLTEHRINVFIDSVLSAEKNLALFRRLRRVRATVPHWMIGDQLDRDVLPAVEADFNAILFEGGFAPSWTKNIERAKPYFSVEDYVSAVKLAIER